MKIEYPTERLIPGLRRLWQRAFGDSDAFLDAFFSTGYAPDHCRCIPEGNAPAAALYWLDMEHRGQKLAYLYAVATDPDARGRGLCRSLMADTATILKQSGYQGILLVPQDEGLRAMYSRMGYLPATTLEESIHAAGEVAVSIAALSAEEFQAARFPFLPENSPWLSAAPLHFLETQARFYQGEDFLAAVSREPEHLRILEYLGNPAQLPGLITALGRTEATVRTPGGNLPFAMYLPLTPDCHKPDYVPFAFD